jgi:ribonuclease VapC
VIVVDASALVAIIFEEPGWQGVARRLYSEAERAISPMSVVEATMVVSRTNSNPRSIVADHIGKAAIVICAIDAAQAHWAQHAFLTYGKGRHSVRLNLGDCFSYAAAKALNAPLLFVGNDFAQTDISAA